MSKYTLLIFEGKGHVEGTVAESVLRMSVTIEAAIELIQASESHTRDKYWRIPVLALTEMKLDYHSLYEIYLEQLVSCHGPGVMLLTLKYQEARIKENLIKRFHEKKSNTRPEWS